MMEKLNRVTHDDRTGIVFISLRPRTFRKPVASLECPGRVLLDIDEEGDVYGVRILGLGPQAAREVLRKLRASPPDPPSSGEEGSAED